MADREQYQQEQWRIRIRRQEIAEKREQLELEDRELERRSHELTGILSVVETQPTFTPSESDE